MNQARKISALFSTYNRADFLQKALHALTQQTLHRDLFEVIVIDDGSEDHTAEVVASFESTLPIQYAHQTNQGLAEGKNHALRLATSPIAVFMDDDDLASPQLLEMHLKTHIENPDLNVAVLGYTDLSETLRGTPLMHFVTEVGCYLFAYPRLKNGETLDYTYFWGGRSSCKRALLLEKGLFDPVFRFGCEDIELGYRLKEQGPFRVLYNKSAKSTMIRQVSLDEFLKRVWRQGQSNYVFSQKHFNDEVTSWTDTYNLDSRWKNIENRADLFIAAARGLDAICTSRTDEGITIDDFTLALLHRSYWQAIDSARLRGSYEKMVSELGQQSAKGIEK